MIVPLWGSFILHFNARLVKTIFPFQRQSGTFHNFHLIFFPPNWQNMSIFNVELKTLKRVNWHRSVWKYLPSRPFHDSFWRFYIRNIATIYGLRLDLFAATKKICLRDTYDRCRDVSTTFTQCNKASLW